MILDIRKFLEQEKPYWDELEAFLRKRDADDLGRMGLAELKRFHYLYERASSDIARLATFSAEPQTLKHLETLVARAYGQIHEVRETPHRLQPLEWLMITLPVTFRRHINAFLLAVAITIAGVLIGTVFLMIDSESKDVLMPFGNLMQNPSERVAEEESRQEDHLAGQKGQGAAFYITHNTQVALVTLSLGITWGLGSILMLFYNGIILGAVCTDYVLAGKTVFLMGWLLPHGATEIPAILIAGQAAFLIAHAMIGWRSRKTLRERMREVSADLVTITGGVVILLIWAGVVEAYLSQYHDPVLPYWIKITFGTVTMLLLVLYLGLGGRGKSGNRSAS